MKKALLVAVLLLAFCSAYPCQAQPVVADNAEATITTDNHYEFFISNDDSVEGTKIGQSDKFGLVLEPPTYDWQTPETFGSFLVPGNDYFLHIKAVDDGAWAGVLGEFSIAGLPTLYTNTVDWKVSATNWGVGYVTPTFVGNNGDAPWGAMSGISSEADWIWTNDAPQGQLAPSVRYFTTKVTAVPEPISAGLFLIGGGALALIRRKKSA